MLDRKFETYYVDEDFKVDIEELNGNLFVHVFNYNFSPTIYKRMREVWFKFLADAYYDGYEFVFSYTSNVAFAKRFGALFDQEIPWSNGGTKWVVHWDLRD